ncbi:hypothetical protein Tco_1252028, partial [Tanacetum coccineum]
DSTFSGGGDDEGSVAASWSMVLNRHPYCTGFGHKRQDDMVWRGTVGGSTGARCSSSSLSFSTSSSSLSSSDDSLS